ncbi:guanine nucleotide-binding protein G(I)/G(S)/G(T) subunit beta-1 [Metschnikowia aff. pulcherrima]|uniref:Guanine nucleotide-binding protein G(I)/G(S)/G(T) subunit beta-1 n=2 Tax=Metschnikowia TaxID=27320 RepID=A0A4P6XVP9_9ASCO|nr:guanine nucleotide-binding protein G(I)/G(S)/G(T) subunit beta-1 [Metschnikowia aff. pulcherrima]
MRAMPPAAPGVHINVGTGNYPFGRCRLHPPTTRGLYLGSTAVLCISPESAGVRCAANQHLLSSRNTAKSFFPKQAKTTLKQIPDLARNTSISEIMLTVTESMLAKLLVAKQTCQVLYLELQKSNLTIQDTTLQKASANLPQIPPKRYLRQYNTLKGHQDKIAQIKWSSDSVKLVSACQDGFMIIWDAVSGLKLQAIPLDSPWVLLCAFAPLGRFVALAGLDNRCTVYKVEQPEDYYMQSRTNQMELRDRGRKIPRAHAAYVSACEFLADDQVLTASGDMTVALWDMEKHVRSRDFLDHCGDVLSLLVAPRERMLPQTFLLAGADGTVKLWDIRVKAPQALCQMSRVDINCVSLLPNGYSFVSGDDEGICKIYDFRSLCELEQYNLREQFEPPRLPGNNSPTSTRSMWLQFDAPGVVSLDLSHLGRILYACYADYGCLAWDILRKEIVELIGVGNGSHKSRISQVAISPDGQGLATASWDATIKIWST